MPRLIVRKSALSTTHYCRRWIPGNSAKTQRRKPSEECNYYSSSSSSGNIPSGTGGRHPPETDGRGQGGGVAVGVAGERTGTGLIGAGVRVILNIFRWFRLSRCALVVFLVLFFTLFFFKLTSDNYDSDLDTPYPDSGPDMKPGFVDNAPPRALTLNAANYRLSRPDCNALEAGDEREISLIEDMLYKESRAGIPNSYFEASTINCSHFRSLRNYAHMADSVYELQTPLAYVIAVKSSAEQVERLLRAVYTPQNIYCLYSLGPASIDFKTSDLGQAVHRIAGCFGNVFVTSGYHQNRSSDVPVAPYRVCLEALLAYPSWRYVLLTSEGDFPLKTNREIVDSVRHAVAAWRLKRTNGHSQASMPSLNAGNDFSGFVLTRKMAELKMRLLANQPYDKTNVYKMHARRELLPDFSDLKIRLDNICPDGKPCFLTSSDLHWLLKEPFLFARRFDLQIDYVVISCLETRLKMLSAANQEVPPAAKI